MSFKGVTRVFKETIGEIVDEYVFLDDANKRQRYISDYTMKKCDVEIDIIRCLESMDRHYDLMVYCGNQNFHSPDVDLRKIFENSYDKYGALYKEYKELKVQLFSVVGKLDRLKKID